MNPADGVVQADGCDRSVPVERGFGSVVRRPLPTLGKVILLAAEPARGTAVGKPNLPRKRLMRD